MFRPDLRFAVRCGIFAQLHEKLDPALVSNLYHSVRAIIPEVHKKFAEHAISSFSQPRADMQQATFKE
jgi:hypothetical protein